MSSIERARACAVGLLAAAIAVNCAGREPDDRGATDCQQKRALWETEFPKIPPGPPPARIEAIHRIAERIGEDPERCAAELVRTALQAERARLLTLRVNGQSLPAAAVYTCSALSVDLKCIGSVADDTAHIAETPERARPLTSGQRVKLEVDASLASTTIRVYLGVLSSLMDAPKYTELTSDDTGMFMVPSVPEQAVLFAVMKEQSSGVYNKFVWLVTP